MMFESGAKPSNRPGVVLAWCSLSFALLLVCLRVMTEYTPFPWWDVDPFTFPVPASGLTPTLALITNYLMIIASSGVVWGVHRAGGRVLLVPGVCIIVAEAAVLFHATQSLNTLMPALDLLASACAGYACWHATQLPRGRAVIAGITIGLVGVLGVIGLHEIFIQHPQTVAFYESQKDSFLASRGWTPGSFQALSYERRLSQPDPTAWFGLSNVYASIVGAMTIGLGVLGWRERKSKFLPIYFAGLLLGGVVVVLSRSTGAMGSLVIAAGILGLCAWTPKLRVGFLAILASIGVVGAVIARGFIGERIGELSILFRSQYMQGAARIYGEHPIVGVGPGNFQDNYARLKPPTSPEDVSSPHSIAFDFISTLGIGGVALLAVFVMMVWSISPRRLAEQIGVDKPDTKYLLRLIGLIVVMSSALSIRLATGTMDPELIGVQVLGVVGWGCVAVVIALYVNESTLQWVLGGAATVLFVHGQLDLTPTFAVSAPLFAVMIGGAGTILPKPSTKRDRGSMVLLAAIGLGVGVFIASQSIRSIAWSRALDRAGSAAHEFGDLREEDPTNPLLIQHERLARGLVAEDLLIAAIARPDHTPTWIVHNEQLFWLLTSNPENQPFTGEDWSEIIEVIIKGVDEEGISQPAKRLRWAGTFIHSIDTRLLDGPDRKRWREQALGYWIRAAELTPHDPNLAVMIMDGHLQLDEQDQAQEWAIRALGINERMHLDPLRQFDDQTLSRVRKIAGQ